MRLLPILLLAGLLSGCLETSREGDPVFLESPVGPVSADEVAQWNQAAAWGNHADAGYLHAEAFTSSAAATIDAGAVASWNQAVAWGNHADAGYLTTAAFGLAPASHIDDAAMAGWTAAASWGNHAEAGYLTANAFAQTPASRIEDGAIASWTTAASWGNHAQAGYLMASAFAETPAGRIGGGDVSRWDEAWNWGNHANAGYLTQNQFNESAASRVTTQGIDGWNQAYSWGDHHAAGYVRAEDDPKVGHLSMGAVPRWDGTSLADGALHERNGFVGVGTDDPGSDLEVWTRPAIAATIGAENPTHPSSVLARSVWQSFTPTVTGYLDSIEIWVASAASPIDLTLRLYAGEGNRGQLLVTQETQVAPGTGFATIRFWRPHLVTWATTYTFELTTPATATLWIGTSPNLYAGGRSNAGTDSDLTFRARTTQVQDPAPTLRVHRGRAEVRNVLRLEPRDVAPPDPVEGDVYYDGQIHSLRVYDGVAWRNL